MTGDQVNERLVGCGQLASEYHIAQIGDVHFNNDLYSVNFATSSSLRKSFVFCARSFRSSRASFCCATTSEAVASNRGINEERSMSARSVRIWPSTGSDAYSAM